MGYVRYIESLYLYYLLRNFTFCLDYWCQILFNITYPGNAIMSRAFSTARQSFAKWLGYNKESLTPDFKQAAEHYAENGAVKVLYYRKLTDSLLISF